MTPRVFVSEMLCTLLARLVRHTCACTEGSGEKLHLLRFKIRIQNQKNKNKNQKIKIWKQKGKRYNCSHHRKKKSNIPKPLPKQIYSQPSTYQVYYCQACFDKDSNWILQKEEMPLPIPVLFCQLDEIVSFHMLLMHYFVAPMNTYVRYYSSIIHHSIVQHPDKLNVFIKCFMARINIHYKDSILPIN